MSPELPLTHSGKRSEMSVRAALKSERPTNLDALRNPDCLAAIVSRVARADSEASQPAVAATRTGSIEEELTNIWQGVLGVSPIGPDDDFFETGGTSLLTAPLVPAGGRSPRPPPAALDNPPCADDLVAGGAPP